MKDSANLHPSSSWIYTTKRTTSCTTAIQSYSWNWDCISPTFLMFYCSINHHGWKITSTSTLVNVQLQKMILKKISLSWWTTRSLVSLFYLHVYFFFYVLMFWFIHWFIHFRYNNEKFEELMQGGLSDIRRKAEKILSSTLLQTI